MVPRHFWRTTKVTGVLPSCYSEIRGATVRIAKTNAILKRPLNKLGPMENNIQTLNKQIRQGNKT